MAKPYRVSRYRSVPEVPAAALSFFGGFLSLRRWTAEMSAEPFADGGEDHIFVIIILKKKQLRAKILITNFAGAHM